MGPGDREARGLSTLTARAVRAAVALGRRHGLRCDDPAVLSDRGNALVWLRPFPVVARVATLTAFTRRDPAAWLAREVAVARHVAAAGGPVVPPSDVLDPGPHAEDGLTLTCWRHVRLGDRAPTAVEAGATLAGFHAASASCPEPLAELTPVRDQIADALDALDAVGTDVRALRREHASVLAGLDLGGPHGVLHGDAHPGNLVSVAGRLLWTDLEEACRGPLAWDLAVLSRTTALDGAAAVRAYAAITGVDVPDLAPWVRARRLEGAVWALGMAHQDPGRYAAVAAELVARLSD